MSVVFGSDLSLRELREWSHVDAKFIRGDGLLTIKTPRPLSDGEWFYVQNFWCSVFGSIYGDGGLAVPHAARCMFLKEIPRRSLALRLAGNPVRALGMKKLSSFLLRETVLVEARNIFFLWSNRRKLREHAMVSFSVSESEYRRLSTLGVEFEEITLVPKRDGQRHFGLFVRAGDILELTLEDWSPNPN